MPQSFIASRCPSKIYLFIPLSFSTEISFILEMPSFPFLPCLSIKIVSWETWVDSLCYPPDTNNAILPLHILKILPNHHLEHISLCIIVIICMGVSPLGLFRNRTLGYFCSSLSMPGTKLGTLLVLSECFLHI